MKRLLKEENRKWLYLTAYIFILAICMLMLIRGYRHKNEVILDWTASENTSEEFAKSDGFIDETSGSSGEWLVFDNLTIMKGSYQVKVMYHTDTDSNRFYFTWGENTYRAMKMEITPLFRNKQQSSTCIWVDDSRVDYRMALEYCGNGTLSVEQITISRNMNREIWKCMVLLFVVTAFVVVSYLRKKNREKQFYDGNVVFGLCAIIVVSSVLFATDYLQNYHDLNYHLVRIEALRHQLQSGKLYPSISDYWLNGYGYASSIMYNEILLLIPAILRLLGATMMTAYKCFAVSINVITCLCAYFSIKEMTKDSKISLLGSALYTLSMFRISDLGRHAVGEYSAMAFLPCIICGLYLILSSEQKKEKNKGILYCVIGYSGVIGSHVITLMFAAFFSVLAVLPFVRKVFHKDTLIALLKMIGTTILVNLYWLIPFLDFYFTEPLQVGETAKIQKSSVQLANLFLIFDTGTGSNFDSDYSIAYRGNWGLGAGLLLGFGIFMYFLFQYRKIQNKKLWQTTVTCMGIGSLAAFMSTVLFPFDTLMDWFPIVQKLFGSIQFTWRLLSIATAALTIGTCCILYEIKTSHRKEVYSFVIVVLTICIGIPYFYQVGSQLRNDRPSLKIYDVGPLNTADVVGGEYLVPGSDPTKYVENEWNMSENVHALQFSKNGTTATFSVNEIGNQEGYVEVPLMCYSDYRVYDMNSHTKLAVSRGTNNKVSVTIPAGFSGDIVVKYHVPWYWIAGEIVSILFVVGYLLDKVIVKKCMERNRNEEKQ